MEDRSKTIIIVATAILVVVAGVGLWFWRQGTGTVPQTTELPGKEELSPVEANETLGGQILEKSQNPFKGEMPETKPFQAEINPLKDIYKNPF